MLQEITSHFFNMKKILIAFLFAGCSQDCTDFCTEYETEKIYKNGNLIKTIKHEPKPVKHDCHDSFQREKVRDQDGLMHRSYIRIECD